MAGKRKLGSEGMTNVRPPNRKAVLISVLVILILSAGYLFSVIGGNNIYLVPQWTLVLAALASGTSLLAFCVFSLIGLRRIVIRLGASRVKRQLVPATARQEAEKMQPKQTQRKPGVDQEWGDETRKRGMDVQPWASKTDSELVFLEPQGACQGSTIDRELPPPPLRRLLNRISATLTVLIVMPVGSTISGAIALWLIVKLLILFAFIVGHAFRGSYSNYQIAKLSYDEYLVQFYEWITDPGGRPLAVGAVIGFIGGVMMAISLIWESKFFRFPNK